MKIIKKLKWVLFVILIAAVGALLNENFTHYYISKIVFYYILIGGILSAKTADLQELRSTPCFRNLSARK